MSYLVGSMEVFISRVLLLVPAFLLETCGYSPYLINPHHLYKWFTVYMSMLMYCERQQETSEIEICSELLSVVSGQRTFLSHSKLRYKQRWK